MKLRLQARASLFIVGLIALIVLALSGALLVQFRGLMGEMRRANSEAMTSGLLEQADMQGRGLAQFLARALINPLYQYRMDVIFDLARSARNQSGVAYVQVYDTTGAVVHDGTETLESYGTRLDDDLTRRTLATGDIVTLTADNTLHVSAPITIGSRRLGGVRIGLSLEAIAGDIAAVGRTLDRINERGITNHILATAVVAVALSILGIFLSVLVARRLAHPIAALAGLARRVGQGEYDARISLRRSDEIGDLAVAFDRMVENLARMQAALREGEERIHLITDAVPALIAYVDAEQRYQFVNKRFEEWYACSREDVVGKHVTEIRSKAVYREIRPYIEAALSGREVSFETVRRFGDGKIRNYQANLVPRFGKDGQVLGYYALGLDITERKRAEEALRKSEERFRDFAAASSDWFWEMDENLRFSYFSEHFTEVTGVPPEMLLGKTREETGVPDVDPDEWETHLANLAARRSFREFRHSRTHTNGRAVHLSINGKSVFDEAGNFKGYRGTGSDITARKEAEQALKNAHDTLERRVQNRTAELRESEERFRAIFDQAAVGMGLMTPKGRFLRVNRKLCELMRRDADEVYLLRFEDFTHPEDYAACVKQIARLLTGEISTFSIEMRYVSPKDGEDEFRFGNLTVSVLREPDSDGFALLGIVEDVTERKATESTARDRAARLRDLQTQLLHVSRLSAMGQLASALAHELNQPLTAVMNYVQASRRLMQRDGRSYPAKVLSSMEEAVDQADRAGEIIRRLRGFIEQGESELLREDINLVVAEAADLGLAGAREKGISVKLDLGADLPPLFMDKIQIQQVVVNLVRNSVDAMAGSKRRELTLTTSRRKNATVKVAIRDTGTGIPEKIEKDLFKPFVTTKADGMGIGLSISHAIIDAHGGHLATARNPDGGTTFSFSLPSAMPINEDHDRKAHHLHPG